MSGMDLFELRQTFGCFLSGVTVVTALDDSGRPVGFTANSFSSVSLDPPLLLVCPSRSLSSFPVFEQCRHFAINILAEGQESVSNTFAAFKGNRFAQVDWETDPNGCPLLAGTAARFSCRTARVLPAGDHVILVGEVVGFARSGLRGLGFAAGQYFSLGLERDADDIPPEARRAYAGVIIEHDDSILLSRHKGRLRPPQLSLQSPARIRAAVTDWLVGHGFDLTLGNAYSIFDDAANGNRYTIFRAEAANGETRGLGQYYPVSTLTDLDFASVADASMLARFALEHRTRAFGLYIGDEHEGDLINYSERA